MKSLITISLFILTFSPCLAQTTSVNGKLVVNKEEESDVAQKVTVHLKDGNNLQSVLVDKNLMFSFVNIKNERVVISFSPPSYSTNSAYTINLKDQKNDSIKIPYSSKCKYSKRFDNTCPKCHKKDQVIPISYGLSASISKREEKQNLKTFPGGCIISDCQPTWHCERDKLEF